MLDPLTALGLAASVVQFVDFALKVVRQVDLRVHGLREASTVGVLELENVAKDLHSLSEPFRRQDQANGSSPRAASESPEEKALNELFEKCHAIAESLITCLSRITRSKSKPGETRRWENIRAAVLTVWNKEKINGMAEDLNIYRQELVLRILVLLEARTKEHATQIHGRFDRLDQRSQEIVEVVAINQANTIDALEQQTRLLLSGSNDDKAVAMQRHAETIAAILTLRDGSTQTISKVATDCDYHEHHLREGPQTALTLRRKHVSSADDDILQPGLHANLVNFTSVSKIVLDALFFRQMDHRYEEVAQAHRATFDWIFSEPMTEKPWDDFVEWLQSSKGCYWLSGKAGSGKSTLMRYISEDVRTRETLRTWAAGRELVVSSFFFWYLGSSLQKSQSGLLRSLLFNILQARQHLIPLVFPSLWRVANSKNPDLSDLTLAELKKGFTTLLLQQDLGLQYFFLIDGLDEYEGDDAEIAQFFTSFTNLPNVKFLLSSRPTPGCVDALSEFPTLNLQDLTYNDIRLYVQDTLGSHPRMKVLETQHKERAQALMEEITKRASGVFLWVMLVVKSLLVGLRNFDRLEDLQRRLWELPTDLENLYNHMLSTMSAEYRVEASRIMQIVLHSTEIQQLHPLTALQMSFIEEDMPSGDVHAACVPLTDVERQARWESVEGRIRAVCCGLVELQGKRRKRFFWSEKADPVVRFLHRTVDEFLSQPRMQSQLSDFVAGTGFDASFALATSCVHLIRGMNVNSSALSEDGALLRSAVYCLRHLQVSKCSASRRVRVLLGLDQVASFHWQKAPREFSFIEERSQKTHWSLALMKAKEQPLAPAFASVSGEQRLGIIWLSALFGMTDLLSELISDPTTSIAHSDPLLGQLVLSLFDGSLLPSRHNSEPRAGNLSEYTYSSGIHRRYPNVAGFRC